MSDLTPTPTAATPRTSEKRCIEDKIREEEEKLMEMIDSATVRVFSNRTRYDDLNSSNM
jgi:hypothetical protein